MVYFVYLLCVTSNYKIQQKFYLAKGVEGNKKKMKQLLLIGSLVLSINIFGQVKSEKPYIEHQTHIRFDTLLIADKYTVEVEVKSYTVHSKTFLRHNYRRVSQKDATDSFMLKLLQFRGDSSIKKIGESKSDYYQQDYTNIYYFEINSLDSAWVFYEMVEYWGGVSKIKIRAKIANDKLNSIENLLKKRYLHFEDSALSELLFVNNLSKENVFLKNVFVSEIPLYDYNPDTYMKKVDVNVVLPPSKYSIIISYLIYPIKENTQTN